MKIQFTKSNHLNEVKIVNKDGIFQNFSYIEFVKHLYNEGKIEEPTIEDTYSEDEIASITELIEQINMKCDEQKIGDKHK